MDRQSNRSISWVGSKASLLFSGSVLGLGMPLPSAEVQAAIAISVGSSRSDSEMLNSSPSGAA